jgi:hypothetical protein
VENIHSPVDTAASEQLGFAFALPELFTVDDLVRLLEYITGS